MRCQASFEMSIIIDAWPVCAHRKLQRRTGRLRGHDRRLRPSRDLKAEEDPRAR